ncbi:MAG: serine/threonine protein kinase [Myxococcales bacterium]|nr:serine/threonine protein kinase [Myxococcales bacterium]
MALEPARIQDFQIAGSLGSGTTAQVYDAVHLATGRPVAIKVLEPSQAGDEMRERFAREAVLLAALSSRHVCNILGFGFERGQPFLVLDRLVGETLDAKLRRDGAVPMALALPWIEQLLLGVKDCHDARIIHRDLKPSNIFLHHDPSGLELVKLIDFGVARLRELSGGVQSLTSTNHLIGSMGYMAPEQFRDAKSVTFASDLYAVGVVVHRMLTGRLPFVSRSLEAVIKMKTERDAPKISSFDGMPKSDTLDWFVQKAMAREPEHRFQSAREMLEAWWGVVSSLDQEEATTMMTSSDVGRVDESYYGQRPLPPDPADPTLPPPSERDSSQFQTLISKAPTHETFPDEDAHTLPGKVPLPPEAVPPKPSRSRRYDDEVTRADTSLEALVERERELHRRRRRG